MKKKSLRSLALAAAAGFLISAGAGSAMAQETTVTTNQKVPISSGSLDANACIGEPITYTGTMNMVEEVTNDGQGNLTFHLHSNFQNVTGVGQFTQRVFKGQSVNNDVYETGPLPTTHTVTVTNKWVGKGKGAPTMFYHLTYNMTVGTNGMVTHEKTNERIECK